jgi:ankyrin repeat protein
MFSLLPAFLTGRNDESTLDKKDRARLVVSGTDNITTVVEIKDGKEIKVRAVRTQSLEIVPGSHEAFINACKTGKIDEIKALLHFVNSDQPDEQGIPGIVWAARMNQLAVVQHMVQKKCNLDIPSRNGNTAIKVACEFGFLEVAQELVKGGAELNIPDSKGDTAVIMACRSGYILLAREILDHKNGVALVNVVNAEGKAGIHEACIRGKAGIVELLLEKQADVNLVISSTGATPLLVAVADGHLAVVQVLVKGKADLNIQSKKGNSALMVAAKKEKVDILKYLLEAGADTELKDTSGETAEQMAKSLIRPLFRQHKQRKRAESDLGARQSPGGNLNSHKAVCRSTLRHFLIDEF